jgi:hypothetical protein
MSKKFYLQTSFIPAFDESTQPITNQLYFILNFHLFSFNNNRFLILILRPPDVSQSNRLLQQVSVSRFKGWKNRFFDERPIDEESWNRFREIVYWTFDEESRGPFDEESRNR